VLSHIQIFEHMYVHIHVYAHTNIHTSEQMYKDILIYTFNNDAPDTITQHQKVLSHYSLLVMAVMLH